jgi:hypothetical protein
MSEEIDEDIDESIHGDGSDSDGGSPSNLGETQIVHVASKVWNREKAATKLQALARGFIERKRIRNDRYNPLGKQENHSAAKQLETGWFR